MPNGDTLCTTPLSHLFEATPLRAPTSARFSNDIERTSFLPSELNSSICTLMFVPELNGVEIDRDKKSRKRRSVTRYEMVTYGYEA